MLSGYTLCSAWSAACSADSAANTASPWYSGMWSVATHESPHTRTVTCTASPGADGRGMGVEAATIATVTGRPDVVYTLVRTWNAASPTTAHAAHHAGTVANCCHGTVRVLPHHELLATPAELGRVILA